MEYASNVDWRTVAPASNLDAVGTWITIQVNDASVLIVETEDGPRAFHNVCQHRGRPIKDTKSGRCETLVCPLHGWVYRLNGKLMSAPRRNAFAEVIDEITLAEIPCRVENGDLQVRTISEGAFVADGSDHPSNL